MQDNTDYLKIILNIQETNYKNTLALIGIIELLTEKNIITRDELSHKTSLLHAFAFEQQLDGEATSAPAL